MGDRGNIVMKQENGLFLGVYTHDGGYKVRELAAQAIHAVMEAGRQNDEPYANRIVISQIVGDHWKQGAGYGVSVGTKLEEAIRDNQNDVVVIDWENDRVTIYDLTYDQWTMKTVCALSEFVKTFMPKLDLTFVEKDVHSEWITFEHAGTQHTADLTKVVDNSLGFTGVFAYGGMYHVVTKMVTEGIYRITPMINLDAFTAWGVIISK